LTRNFENFLFFGNLQNFLAAEFFFLDDKLVWDVHSDEERASSYFEEFARASQVRADFNSHLQIHTAL
jgi:hypothetical protein